MPLKTLNFSPDLTILVTGGAGFIGSNLCQWLLNNGNKVRCLDNLATGKKENLDAFFKHTDFTFLEGDIRNLEDCKKRLRWCLIIFCTKPH